MHAQPLANWWTRSATFLVAALASASAAWWALTLNTPLADIPAATAMPLLQVDASALGRALGADVVQAKESAAAPVANIQLLGVVASGAGKGHALIAVGGAQAKTYKVGSAITDGLFLQSVSLRSVTLGPGRSGPSSQILELPPLAKP